MRRLPEISLQLLSAAALMALVVVAAARADEQKPLWEFGLGIGAYAFNDYRGSDTMHAYPIPVPYFMYRGEILKSDHDGPRARFFNRDAIEFNLSINATTPVCNDPHATGNAGSRAHSGTRRIAQFPFVVQSRSSLKLDLRLPARAAVTVEASPRIIGVYAEPQINLDVAHCWGRRAGSSACWAGRCSQTDATTAISIRSRRNTRPQNAARTRRAAAMQVRKL